jgi:alkanesulfonate monooxygenase SsuD/methylene tetrahydromethanopterin reductase-like flavin-dependent oxidoreductase (luciferase family)
MRLSVLDQSISLAGASEDAAIRDTLSLAQDCEALGYHRFWVSEHHGLPTIVGTTPEVLMGAIAARTQRIRIGSAGVMLPHYSALKVAESFRVLDALAPGRIDLGVGRAPGSDRRTAHPRGPVAAQAGDLSRVPVVWILGSSDYGAQLAAHFGLPYAFAYFFMDGAGVEQALHLYRTLYRPSARHPHAQATVCVWALAADTAEGAQHHALSRERWRIDRARGVLGPLRAPDGIASAGFTPEERATLEPLRRRAFVGTAAQVGARLRALAAKLQLDELVVNTWAHEPAARRQSYRLLAQEFSLG